MSYIEFKPVYSKNVYSELVPFGNYSGSFDGYTQVTSALRFTKAQRAAENGRPFSNLYSSFSLPAANFEVLGWDLTWGSNAIQDIDDATEVIVMEIPKNTYGELIDGRTMKLTLPSVSADSITCYTSYYTPINASSDPSAEAEVFGHESFGPLATVSDPSTNVAFLFSDEIARPVNGGSWSDNWATGSPPVGYQDATTLHSFTSGSDFKPYGVSVDSGSGIDKPIGICYLDKGFCVITHETVVNNFNYTAGTKVSGGQYSGASSGFTQITFASNAEATYWSFEKQWILDVECRADAFPPQFYLTDNPTAADLNPNITPDGFYDLDSVNKPVYISEVGLYDDNGDMVAIAKPDRPIEKYSNNSAIFNLKFRF